jgi:hypothetical protein
VTLEVRDNFSLPSGLVVEGWRAFPAQGSPSGWKSWRRKQITTVSASRPGSSQLSSPEYRYFSPCGSTTAERHRVQADHSSTKPLSFSSGQSPSTAQHGPARPCTPLHFALANRSSLIDGQIGQFLRSPTLAADDLMPVRICRRPHPTSVMC